MQKQYIVRMNATQLIHDLLSLGLKQREICEKTGLPQSTVSHLSTGRRGKRPSYETASKLAVLHAKVLANSKKLTSPSPHPTSESEREAA